jgi:hypothetical protein
LKNGNEKKDLRCGFGGVVVVVMRIIEKRVLLLLMIEVRNKRGFWRGFRAKG